MTAPLVVILAGGEGRRIGGHKPLRMLGGERLIDRAVRLARLWSDDIRLSVRAPGQIPALDLPELVDHSDIQGPLAGLHSAVEAARSGQRSSVLTTPCDLPFLPGDLAPRLRAAISDCFAAIASDARAVHPTCALWRAETLNHLPAYLASERRSLIGLAETIGFAQVEWPTESFLNVNSLADLAEAEQRLNSEVEHLDRRSRAERSIVRP